MTPTRILPPLNRSADYVEHCANIAHIIAHADNIAEADLRVGYYMKLVGVNYCEPEVVEAPVLQPAMYDLSLSPEVVDAIFSGNFSGVKSVPVPLKLKPGYDF